MLKWCLYHNYAEKPNILPKVNFWRLFLERFLKQNSCHIPEGRLSDSWTFLERLLKGPLKESWMRFLERFLKAVSWTILERILNESWAIFEGLFLHDSWSRILVTFLKDSWTILERFLFTIPERFLNDYWTILERLLKAFSWTILEAEFLSHSWMVFERFLSDSWTFSEGSVEGGSMKESRRRFFERFLKAVSWTIL